MSPIESVSLELCVLFALFYCRCIDTCVQRSILWCRDNFEDLMFVKWATGKLDGYRQDISALLRQLFSPLRCLLILQDDESPCLTTLALYQVVCV